MIQGVAVTMHSNVVRPRKEELQPTACEEQNDSGFQDVRAIPPMEHDHLSSDGVHFGQNLFTWR